jgi:hypothetical protein
MAWPDDYKNWLVAAGEIKTDDGESVTVWEFRHQDDGEVLKTWARHFRNHYCRDDQIDALRNGTGKSRAKDLTDVKFPDPVAPRWGLR